MTTPLFSTAPVSVVLIQPGDIVRYGGETYRAGGYVHYAVLDGGVLLANRVLPDGSLCPTQVALPFPNIHADAELVTGGVL